MIVYEQNTGKVDYGGWSHVTDYTGGPGGSELKIKFFFCLMLFKCATNLTVLVVETNIVCVKFQKILIHPIYRPFRHQGSTVRSAFRIFVLGHDF